MTSPTTIAPPPVSDASVTSANMSSFSGENDTKSLVQAQEAAPEKESQKGATTTSKEQEAAEEPELRDLESSLLALEKLDRASPDLWPDHSE